MASIAQQRSSAAKQAVWVGGLSMEDFEIPSQKTEIAMVTSVITKVAFDLADASTSLPAGGEQIEVLNSAEVPDGDALGSIVDQVLASWGDGDNDQDFAV
ncbi:MAG: hypothetical protein KKA05_12215, partial [Alphaproteobacteria bacterium]|nr:hypothetical protein [Alphaproteobacteria bacterium]